MRDRLRAEAGTAEGLRPIASTAEILAESHLCHFRFKLSFLFKKTFLIVVKYP